VYNIESQAVGSFDEDDRQFAEIFGRYVAIALNILNLLVVERYTTSGQMAENVVQEMAQPLNDIATEARQLKESVDDPDELRRRLDQIIEHVHNIRECVRDVASGPRTVLGAEQVGESEEEGDDDLLAHKHVLVADDEQNIRETIADVLRKQGCETMVASDGFEAATLLDQHDFDLVISDIKMPYRNGYEIFAAARRARADMPVILMTGFGYDPSHSIVRASEEGLSTVLFKPFKVEDFLAEVRQALGGEDQQPTSSDASDEAEATDQNEDA
ncbi:MAG: response regulator, partial [Phycisphaeraceae bacterium]|nr:response regulator [Phycisphaeraceae bacterium]